jgi:hypothetical protein
VRDALRIRACEPGDLVSVADHYERVFRHGSGPASPALVDAMRGLFLQSPTWAADIPPLVIETADGIEGFQGIQVRDFVFDGKPGRYASFGPLFVTPALRARAAGMALMKAALAGRQDLSISDGASDQARWLWERAGGRMATAQSMTWVIPLAPIGYGTLAMSARHDGWRSKLMRALRPLAGVADQLIAARWLRALPKRALQAPETRPLTIDAWCAIGDRVGADYRFRVVTSAPVAQWIMHQLLHFTCRGELIAREVRKGGRSLGSYIGYASPQGIFTLMQLQARVADMPAVLAALVGEALGRHWVAVTGRLEGALPGALGDYRALYHRGTQVLLHGSDREMLNSVASLDALVSRTDGEWLMNLREQVYAR